MLLSRISLNYWSNYHFRNEEIDPILPLMNIQNLLNLINSSIFNDEIHRKYLLNVIMLRCRNLLLDDSLMNELTYERVVCINNLLNDCNYNKTGLFQINNTLESNDQNEFELILSMFDEYLKQRKNIIISITPQQMMLSPMLPLLSYNANNHNNNNNNNPIAKELEDILIFLVRKWKHIIIFPHEITNKNILNHLSLILNHVCSFKNLEKIDEEFKSIVDFIEAIIRWDNIYVTSILHELCYTSRGNSSGSSGVNSLSKVSYSRLYSVSNILNALEWIPWQSLLSSSSSSSSSSSYSSMDDSSNTDVLIPMNVYINITEVLGCIFNYAIYGLPENTNNNDDITSFIQNMLKVECKCNILDMNKVNSLTTYLFRLTLSGKVHNNNESVTEYFALPKKCWDNDFWYWEVRLLSTLLPVKGVVAGLRLISFIETALRLGPSQTLNVQMALKSLKEIHPRLVEILQVLALTRMLREDVDNDTHITIGDHIHVCRAAVSTLLQFRQKEKGTAEIDDVISIIEALEDLSSVYSYTEFKCASLTTISDINHNIHPLISVTALLLLEGVQINSLCTEVYNVITTYCGNHTSISKVMFMLRVIVCLVQYAKSVKTEDVCRTVQELISHTEETISANQDRTHMKEAWSSIRKQLKLVMKELDDDITTAIDASVVVDITGSLPSSTLNLSPRSPGPIYSSWNLNTSLPLSEKLKIELIYEFETNLGKVCSEQRKTLIEELEKKINSSNIDGNNNRNTFELNNWILAQSINRMLVMYSQLDNKLLMRHLSCENCLMDLMQMTSSTSSRDLVDSNGTIICYENLIQFPIDMLSFGTQNLKNDAHLNFSGKKVSETLSMYHERMFQRCSIDISVNSPGTRTTVTSLSTSSESIGSVMRDTSSVLFPNLNSITNMLLHAAYVSWNDDLQEIIASSQALIVTPFLAKAWYWHFEQTIKAEEYNKQKHVSYMKASFRIASSLPTASLSEFLVLINSLINYHQTLCVIILGNKTKKELIGGLSLCLSLLDDRMPEIAAEILLPIASLVISAKTLSDTDNLNTLITPLMPMDPLLHSIINVSCKRKQFVVYGCASNNINFMNMDISVDSRRDLFWVVNYADDETEPVFTPFNYSVLEKTFDTNVTSGICSVVTDVCCKGAITLNSHCTESNEFARTQQYLEYYWGSNSTIIPSFEALWNSLRLKSKENHCNRDNNVDYSSDLIANSLYLLHRHVYLHVEFTKSQYLVETLCSMTWHEDDPLIRGLAVSILARAVTDTSFPGATPLLSLVDKLYDCVKEESNAKNSNDNDDFEFKALSLLSETTVSLSTISFASDKQSEALDLVNTCMDLLFLHVTFIDRLPLKVLEGVVCCIALIANSVHEHDLSSLNTLKSIISSERRYQIKRNLLLWAGKYQWKPSLTSVLLSIFEKDTSEPLRFPPSDRDGPVRVSSKPRRVRRIHNSSSEQNECMWFSARMWQVLSSPVQSPDAVYSKSNTIEDVHVDSDIRNDLPLTPRPLEFDDSICSVMQASTSVQIEKDPCVLNTASSEKNEPMNIHNMSDNHHKSVEETTATTTLSIASVASESSESISINNISNRGSGIEKRSSVDKIEMVKDVVEDVVVAGSSTRVTTRASKSTTTVTNPTAASTRTRRNTVSSKDQSDDVQLKMKPKRKLQSIKTKGKGKTYNIDKFKSEEKSVRDMMGNGINEVPVEEMELSVNGDGIIHNSTAITTIDSTHTENAHQLSVKGSLALDVHKTIGSIPIFQSASSSKVPISVPKPSRGLIALPMTVDHEKEETQYQQVKKKQKMDKKEKDHDSDPAVESWNDTKIFDKFRTSF